MGFGHRNNASSHRMSGRNPHLRSCSGKEVSFAGHLDPFSLSIPSV
jgi:hypothetical protein